MFRDETLVGFYKLNFQIVSGQFGITLSELMDMLPFERNAFTHMIINKVQEKKKQQE